MMAEQRWIDRDGADRGGPVVARLALIRGLALEGKCAECIEVILRNVAMPASLAFIRTAMRRADMSIKPLCAVLKPGLEP